MGLMKSSISGGLPDIDLNGKSLRLTKTDMDSLRDNLEFQAKLRVQFGSELPLEISYHRDRTGSLTIVTGPAPKIWPEDETD